jgi:hypothetical protein
MEIIVAVGVSIGSTSAGAVFAARSVDAKETRKKANNRSKERVLVWG